MMRVLIASLLVALVLAVAVQADINVNLLTHNILKREATCNQECVAMYNNLGKCTEVCAQIVTGNEGIADILEKIQKDQEAAEASTTNTLSDKSAEEVQEEANTQLYELFHTALKELLTSGTYGAGFQIMDPAIELTDITAQVPGWEQRPISDIERQIVEDYDNPAILGEELIQVSTPGPRRDTNGVRFIDEYRSYLSGVQGVSGLAIPNPYTLPSAQRTIDYQNALNTCSERYMNAAYFILARFDIDSYVTTFCREVKAAEDEMLKQIGIEQYQAGNNPVYGAAVALGMAQSLYSASNAYKKFHSFKALEYECIKAREEGRPIQGISKSLSFNYNYHTWKNTQQTLSWKTKKRSFIFKKTVHHTQTINTNFDATSLGGVEIAFADFRNVPVYPGTWFSRSAFRDTRYKPREGHSPISRFFSDQGTLTLMPKSLYVAVNPKIAFWVDNAKKEDFKQTSQTVVTGGFSVFGFGIKSAKNHQINVEEGETQNGKTKITITSTTCKPQLFAVEHHYTY